MRWWGWSLVMMTSSCAESVDGADDDATDPCELEPAIDEAVAASATTVTDCGRVDSQDDLATWQAAHDCALAALSSDMPAKVVWTPMVIDGIWVRAFVGIDDAPYAVTHFDYSGYDTQRDFRTQPCGTVVETEGCVVAVGDMCLECAAAGDPTIICSTE